MTGLVPFLHCDLSKPAKRGPKPRKRIQRAARPRRRSRKRSTVEAADRAWSREVRARAGGYCRASFCYRRATDAHHVMGKKAHPYLRHEALNGIALCRGHHDFAHARPKDFRTWFAAVYPDAWDHLQWAIHG